MTERLSPKKGEKPMKIIVDMMGGDNAPWPCWKARLLP